MTEKVEEKPQESDQIEIESDNIDEAFNMLALEEDEDM